MKSLDVGDKMRKVLSPKHKDRVIIRRLGRDITNFVDGRECRCDDKLWSLVRCTNTRTSFLKNPQESLQDEPSSMVSNIFTR
ncbi:hypothetical protein HID58_041759 [Brassica napus]|uniref:Uncharacterized protein n=1 Tax=Brassica napus TaxID=3708 RepID=A0ABQ8BDD7_BRANA|nr:hypothetical protein HID58_041759 [Brassica napus]